VSVINLANERVLVAVFVQEGCGACEEFLPRFRALADRYQRAGMPIVVYDAAAQDPELVAWMDGYGVSATPTVLVLRRGPGWARYEGALPDKEIEDVLLGAYQVHVGRA
jgi:thiol-disulfide isomerase/thioredoxin